ncbi:MAG: AbrB/MazE/SpoVT family DNA-binding domain-containing protein [Candidatus Daviesbacteria bacterium]|nr:AbrB/MazE/SpoVT family DNA-binding domain-containing protein [Candidatus Daviesbacteria bacterium]
MFYHSSITQKGQATIPLPIRQLLGLKTGQIVIFEKRGEEVILKNQQKLIEQLYGSLKPRVKVKYTDKKADKAIGEFIAQEYRQKYGQTA